MSLSLKQLQLDVSKKLEDVQTTLTGPSGQMHGGLALVYQQGPGQNCFLSKSLLHQCSQKHPDFVLGIEDV